MICACNADTAPRYYLKVARTKHGPMFMVKDRETTSCAGVHVGIWGGFSILTAMNVARQYNRNS